MKHCKQLGMFAKYWQPGKVKTRLAATIGEEAAACLHRTFVAVLCRRLATIADGRILACTPPDKINEMADIAGPCWRAEPQSNGDLGERMQAFFQNRFAGGARHVVLIGSDAPTLPEEFIEQSFAELTAAPVVLGPAEDGGYYLVGMADMVAPIFSGIHWSESTVWEETMRRLSDHNIPCAQLPRWRDVDDLSDLQQLAAELSDHCSQQKSSSWRQELLREIEEVLG